MAEGGRGGFCRLSSGRYTADRASMHDLQMHLTNCAIQRRGADGGADVPAAIKWPVRRRAHAFFSWGTYVMCLANCAALPAPKNGQLLFFLLTHDSYTVCSSSCH